MMMAQIVPIMYFLDQSAINPATIALAKPIAIANPRVKANRFNATKIFEGI